MKATPREFLTAPGLLAAGIFLIPGLCLAAGKPHPPTAGQECQACHAAVRQRKVLHSPVKDGQCGLCHQIPAAGGLASLTESPEKLCLLCHDKENFTAKFVHGPVAVGGCVACHDPHGSENLKLVRAKGRALCVTCHTDMDARLVAAKFRHKPVETECVTCHDPHASNLKFQLKAAAPQLCAACHVDLMKRSRAAQVKHPPVTEARACLNCHDPHVAEHRPQLRADGIATCLACHDRPVKTAGGALTDMKSLLAANKDHHGPIREKNCSGCHQPHGSQDFRLLVKRYPKEFYAPFQPENFALCFGCHESTIPRDERTTTLTDFRDGNRNLHFVHVNQAVKGRTCRSCHETHASNLPSHIRASVPFGKWELPVNFQKAANGGTCSPGCHAPKSYDRGPAKKAGLD